MGAVDLNSNREINVNNDAKLNVANNENILREKSRYRTAFEYKESESDRILVPDNLIRNDEKDLITFSRNGIIELIENMDKLENLNIFHNKNNLKLYCKF